MNCEYFFGSESCGILIFPQSWMEPRPPAVQALSPNHNVQNCDVCIHFFKMQAVIETLLTGWSVSLQ